MTNAALTTALPIDGVAIPVREVLPWAVFGALLLAIGVYFVGIEQGATAVFHGSVVHEFLMMVAIFSDFRATNRRLGGTVVDG